MASEQYDEQVKPCHRNCPSACNHSDSFKHGLPDDD